MKSLALILTKEANDYVNSLKDSLDIDAHIISDNDYEDSLMLKQGFYGITATVKSPSAWDKSFFLLSKLNLIEKYDYFYFIEDDVFSRDDKKINSLISVLNNFNTSLMSFYITSKKNSPAWDWWQKDNFHSLGSCPWNDNSNLDTLLHRSFNPFCRLSRHLVKLILDFRTENCKFYFHEILFATLCTQNDMKTFDLSTNNVSKHFFDTFICRPILNKSNIFTNKIYHPVKPDYPQKV